MARPSKPTYSMAYLHFLATKRKRELEEEVDGEQDAKRSCIKPTMTETIHAVLRETSLGA
jgi:chromatin structure-remodeling complex subunit RSC1/2